MLGCIPQDRAWCNRREIFPLAIRGARHVFPSVCLAPLRKFHASIGNATFATAMRNPRPQSPLLVPPARLSAAACAACVYPPPQKKNLIRTTSSTTPASRATNAVTFRRLFWTCVPPLARLPHRLRTALWGASERSRPRTWVCAWVDSVNAS